MKITFSLLPVLLLTFVNARAQFPTQPNQTFFVCNATGTQNTVRAFDDGNGGTYSFWIDKRHGDTATCIFGQHLDSLGVPQWPANGKLMDSAIGRTIWNINAVKWQSGFLIAWIQGAGGGDTLFCNYCNLNGVSQWSQPTLVANRQPNIINVDGGNYTILDIYPTITGATITCQLIISGGNETFNFNKINFGGLLKYPLDSIQIPGGGSYYVTANDNRDGFYTAASSGGLGTHIYVTHVDSTGKSTIASPVDISTVAGGRANDVWRMVCDNAGNDYVVWDDNSSEDVHICKVRQDGTLPWAGGGGAISICTAAGSQINTNAIIAGDTVYAIWDDARPGASGQYDIYMQKVDTNGHSFWTTNGIQLCNLTSYIPYAGMVKTGNSLITTYEVNSGFFGQKIEPDSAISWQKNGTPICTNLNDVPFYGDYVLVSTGNGNVTAIWSTNTDICAARVLPDGLLTGLTRPVENSMGIYPNPATNNFTVRLNQNEATPVTIGVYNLVGELVQQKQFAISSDGAYNFNTENLQSGFYFVKVVGGGYNLASKICVVKN